ncbi:MAG: hypothetical protein QOI81_1529 [Actinomycetota bacterium]|nr:hypothetical protein [Actinomycetota bacterium]
MRSSNDRYATNSYAPGRSDRRAVGMEPPARIIGFPQVQKPSQRIRRIGQVAAVLIAAGGYVHLCLYRHGYRVIPKIGVGFLLTVIASGILALGLLVLRGRTNRLARLAGIALSVGTLIAFALSRTPAGLFAFREMGFQPSPQAAFAVLTESGALLLLLGTLLMDRTPPRGRVTQA